MSYVSRTRVATALGLLSIILSVVGVTIHGYPAMDASGKEIVDWATTTSQQQFTIGIYVEALGTLLFLPFAAWLYTVAQRRAWVGSPPEDSVPLCSISVSASWTTASGPRYSMVPATVRIRRHWPAFEISQSTSSTARSCSVAC